MALMVVLVGVSVLKFAGDYMSFLKRYVLIIILLLILLFLLYLKVFITPKIVQQLPSLTITPTLSPPQTLLQTIPPITPVEYLPSDVDYKFSGKIPSLPEKTNLLFYENKESTSDEAIKIASIFGFSTKPEILPDTRLGTMYLWNKENESFTAGGTPLEISYSQTVSSLQIGFTQTDNDLIDLAKNKLAQYNLDAKNLNFNSESFIYFKQDEEGLSIVKSKLEANLLQIKAVRSYNGIPTVTRPSGITDVAITIDTTGKLISLSYLFPFKIKEQKEVVLIPASKAISTVKQKGFVMKLVDPQAAPAEDFSGDNYQVSSVDLSSLSLNYFYLRIQGSINNALYPVYVLTGEAINKEGEKLNVVIYLSAFQD